MALPQLNHRLRVWRVLIVQRTRGGGVGAGPKARHPVMSPSDFGDIMKALRVSGTLRQ